MYKFVVDKNIYLTLLERRHAQALFELVVSNADYIGTWLPFAKATQTVKDTETFIESSLREFAAGTAVVSGIWYQDNLVGTIGLHINLPSRSASIGYWIGSAYEGNGIVTESCRALISYAFDELRLHRIEIRANTGNTKSRAIPERLGFTQEGVVRGAFKLYNQFADSVIYGMLSHEWTSLGLGE